MRYVEDEVSEEFEEAQSLRGYERPKNLSEIEREPMNNDVYDIPDAHCPVDAFLRKNRGWR